MDCKQVHDRNKDRDPFFDYIIHLGGAFEKYGRQIFLDTRKSENMNSIDMRALTLVVIDGNHSFIPASESFVFEESLESYRLVCQYTLDMTPVIKAEDVRFGFGDYFLKQEDVQVYFPNIIFLLDTFHFCSAKNDKCILLKDFGKHWYVIQNDFRAAVYSRTKSDCLVRDSLLCTTMCHFHILSTKLNSWFHVQDHLAKAAEKVSSNQGAIDKINKWQMLVHHWANYVREGEEGHCDIETSAFAEQNDSSMKAIAGDDPARSIEQNIIDVMHRTVGGLTNFRN